jgi:hypothetical protein
MKITIEIEVPGATGESVALITGPTGTAGGQTGSASREPELDAGSPPVEAVEQYAAEGRLSNEEGWTDAGSAPESPVSEGSGTDTGGGEAGAAGAAGEPSEQ